MWDITGDKNEVQSDLDFLEKKSIGKKENNEFMKPEDVKLTPVKPKEDKQMQDIAQPMRTKIDDVLENTDEILDGLGDLELRAREFDDFLAQTSVDMKYLSYNEYALPDFKDDNVTMEEIIKGERNKIFQN